MSRPLSEAQRRRVLDSWTVYQFADHFADMLSTQPGVIENSSDFYRRSSQVVIDAAARFGRDAQEAAFERALAKKIAAAKMAGAPIKFDYKNEYGSLTLAPAGDYKHVSSIHSKDVAPALFFSTDDAEKIALITENRSIQLSPVGLDLRQFFIMHHAASNCAAVCKIEKLEFDSRLDATKILEDSKPSMMHMQ